MIIVLPKRARSDVSKTIGGLLVRDGVAVAAWSTVRNLFLSSPTVAAKIMEDAARQAPRWKRAAGIRPTGRKSGGTVWEIVLSWHPDEAQEIDRAEMERAADSLLARLGYDQLEAVYIAHADTAAPHLHIVLNRVLPYDGRLAQMPPATVWRADQWAYDYERERGRIVTPTRAEKYRERHSAGGFVDGP